MLTFFHPKMLLSEHRRTQNKHKTYLMGKYSQIEKAPIAGIYHFHGKYTLAL